MIRASCLSLKLRIVSHRIAKLRQSTLRPADLRESLFVAFRLSSLDCSRAYSAAPAVYILPVSTIASVSAALPHWRPIDLFWAVSM